MELLAAEDNGTLWGERRGFLLTSLIPLVSSPGHRASCAALGHTAPTCASIGVPPDQSIPS